MRTNRSARYEERTELAADAPTPVEGLPGFGMVASIAVDQITTQLELEQHGRIVSDDLPPVASFSDGRVWDPIRVYAGDDPAAVLVVRSNPYIPDPTAARAVIEDALEPLVDFDIDTGALLEQAEGIQAQTRRIAEQLQEYDQPEERQPGSPSTYQ